MYEHSVGSAILANMWASSLCERFPMHVSKHDVLLVTMAALLRNIGCMPWEHTFREFMLLQGNTSTMEESSIKIVSRIMETPPVSHSCKRLHISPRVISDLIIGCHTITPEGWDWSSRLFMFDLVNQPHGCDAVFVDRMMRCDSRLGLRAAPDIRNFIDNSWIGTSSHLVINSPVRQRVTNLENQINKIILENAEVAAISAAIHRVWTKISWIKLVPTDMNLLMRATDVTFKSDTEFIFFHTDMLARRFPSMVSEKEFSYERDANTFMRENPLSGNNVYHVTITKRFMVYKFVVRVFYFSE
jgi:hypothetical protein